METYKSRIREISYFDGERKEVFQEFLEKLVLLCDEYDFHMFPGMDDDYCIGVCDGKTN